MPSRLPEAVEFIRRQWMVVVAVVVLTLALGLAYLFVAAPKYTAKTLLMLDNRKAQAASQSVLSEVSIDSGFVDSQLEVIKSDNIATAVINQLKLGSDPEFVGKVDSFTASLFGALVKLVDIGALDVEPVLSREEQLQKAVAHFKRQLTANRLGRTYVIEIKYKSIDRAKSAQIANAVADAYIMDQLESKYKATKRASSWLQERIGELREEAVSADTAVQDYKAKYNLVDAGKSGLLSEQQLSEVNTQLVAARTQTAEAKARFDRISAINASNITDAAVADSLKNEVLIKLRQQYMEASKREADWSSKYGRDHVAAVNLRREMEQIERVTREELRRIAETYMSDYEIARNREQSLHANLQELIKQASSNRQAQVSLRMLESSAASYRNLYDSFLQRFVESTQQQSFPNTEARVITPAVLGDKSDPIPALVLGLAGAVGLMVGLGSALGREQLDRAFRTTTQVEAQLGFECLGVLPMLSGGETRASRATRDLRLVGERVIAHDLGLSRQVILAPFSRFTETLRAVKVSIDTNAPSRDTQVVGVVSALPGEGKSLVAGNLAELAAHTGSKVLLIDGDLRKPALTRRFVPYARQGLLEVLNGTLHLDDAIWRDPMTGLHVLPAVLSGSVANTSEYLSSAEMETLLSRVRAQYDYVFMDLPPIAPVVDAKAVAPLIDNFLLVVHWGKTARALVQEVVHSSDIIHSKLLGVVLNQADESTMRRLEAYKGKGYYDYYTYSSHSDAA